MTVGGRCITLLLACLVYITMTEATEESKVITKTIFLIRHAESEENRRMQSLGKVVKSLSSLSLPSSNDVYESMRLFHIPSQVDSDVSEVGKQQIRHMGEVLAKEEFLQTKQVQAVMHSPLKRARETCKGVLQCLAGDNLQEELRHTSVNRVLEVPMLAERTPVEWIPGNYEKFDKRIRDWEAYVLEQPEERIAVVGHSQFFKSMLNLDVKFDNCHVWQVQLRNVQGEKDPNFPSLPPQWFGLQQLYKCNHDQGNHQT